ncbi:MAG: hypothetical protein IT426_13320 [Pirellulales bacterium]|nr:hypothetical protein [Pirellulales bacterium]
MLSLPHVRRSAFRATVKWSLLFLIFGGFLSGTVLGDTWTGAGQNPASQIRDWNWIGPTSNWVPGPLPLPNATNFFGLLGEGQINLNGAQSAGSMIFNDFCYSNIALGTGGGLTIASVPSGAASILRMGEGVRDTYGVDYFTAGPQISAPLVLNLLNPPATLSVNLGTPVGNGSNSAMMLSGLITNPLNNGLLYQGFGGGSSLWVSANNSFNGNMANFITVAPGAGAAGGGDGYTLHLVDSGRMDFTPIQLSSTSSYLGLQDNTGGGGVPPTANTYFNWVWSYGGNVFADRSYQLPGNDSNTTVNALQFLAGGLTIYQGTTNFGSTGRFGRTNNGYSVELAMLNWQNDSQVITVNVNNGNLTEGRGGSRYVSGANRLQEPHNYTYVDQLNENAAGVQIFVKGGTGVLAAYNVNGGGQWFTSPQVAAGVLRLGTATNPHNAPSVNLITPDAGVGIAWSTPIDLTVVPNFPFPIFPGGGVPGQSGAVDIDLWNFFGPIINTNIGPMPSKNYLRVASSMGGDASFDPQPNPLKHASVGMGTQIVPYVVGPFVCNIYYFGGGGGTLRIDALLNDYEQRPTMLEMGTTGTLLPGRVALNPGGDFFDDANTFTGATEICAGTLQLMKQNAVWGSSMVRVWTYDSSLTNGLYANPGPYHYAWEGAGNYTWTGPGQLLLDPGRNGIINDWSLGWYTAAGGLPLFNSLQLWGGVIGWTGNVTLPAVPGQYGATLASNLTGVQLQVNVLGLGGEYSAGTMTTQFVITNNGPYPVLLYKAGKNSKLDLRQGGANTYTGGTIIAGGEVIVSNANQLNAHGSGTGGPIAILNGGRLHVTAGTNIAKPIKINTGGTPDLLKNCGSVIEVDAGFTAGVNAYFDFSWSPCGYLEKDGGGTLNYSVPALVANPGLSNAWGLKLTAGLVRVNQLPVNSNADSGPVIFNNGNLRVGRVPVGMTLDANPAYGFRNMVSFQGTAGTVTVEDNAMFRTHGIVPNEILGTVNFVASNPADANSSDNVVHLSRNMASLVNPITPGDYSRGDGAMTFQGVTVYMSGGGQGNWLNVLPQEAGFVLQLNDGVIFNGSRQNNVCGEVNFNNLTPANPAKWVKIDGEEASPATPLGGPPYVFGLTADRWTIYGTGLTTWSGVTEKVGPGIVEISRSQGAPVLINANALIRISGGSLKADGTADPFTDTVSNFSLSIVNDSTAFGLVVSQGTKTVGTITGIGNTTVTGTSTVLNATSIVQNSLVIGGIPPVAAVPEPSTWLLLHLATLVGIGFFGRKMLRRHPRRKSSTASIGGGR